MHLIHLFGSPDLTFQTARKIVFFCIYLSVQMKYDMLHIILRRMWPCSKCWRVSLLTFDLLMSDTLDQRYTLVKCISRKLSSFCFIQSKNSICWLNILKWSISTHLNSEFIWIPNRQSDTSWTKLFGWYKLYKSSIMVFNCTERSINFIHQGRCDSQWTLSRNIEIPALKAMNF